MAAGGYQVNPGLLQEASTGIENTIGELKTLGISEEAEEGRGFGSLSLSQMQMGSGGLQGSFSGFCDRWSWGVRSLVKEGNQIAQTLGLNAGSYYDAEQYAVGVLKDAVNAVAGDPHASNQQVENESFGQIAAADTPDYSAASWDKTGQDAAQTWSGVGRDLAEGPMGLGKDAADALGDGQEFSAMEDQAFGPAPGSGQSSSGQQ